ncbi:MAG: TIGR04211 family SH3 domain-containing protein [Desulfobacterales bacterium]|nr:MAG: TIGR04211 family SH3 domain-containing protein [Desulfobacterales bacterium]
MNMQLKRMVFIGICLTIFSGISYAESMYVTDLIKLTLRSGPSTEYKILAVVESGQQLEVLEPGEDWSLVRLANEKEGYVLTRYLTPEPTHNILLEQLQDKHKVVAQQAAALLEENTQLREENQNLKSTLQDTEQALKKVEQDYQELKAGSAEFITLKTKYKQASENLTEQTKRVEKLDEELSRVEMNQYIKWFLAGSGVLLVGFIIGFSARKQRRRPSLL